MDLFEPDRALAEHPGEVAIGLWFHDAIYDTSRHDNEAASAEWARRALLRGRRRGGGRSRARIDRGHSSRPGPSTSDAKLLVDIDLAILGAGPARFAEYERQIGGEYGVVPEMDFRRKRVAILGGFLERPAIFATPAHAHRFEKPARANLASAIAGLA